MKSFLNNKVHPAVSIVLPAYNVESYIDYCVNSVLAQVFQDFELIIVDDGSSDSTPSIIDSLQTKDIRIKVIHKSNGGVSSARNAGIRIAKGNYITFIDGDDYWAEDFLSYMVNMAISTEADMCMSTVCYLSENEKQTLCERKRVLTAEEGTALLLSPKVFVGCWNKVYNRKVLDEYKIFFDENLFYGEGLNFITTFSQHANKIAVGNRKVYYYRRDNIDSATTSFSIQRIYNGIESLNRIERNLFIKTPIVKEALELHNTLYRLMSLNKIYASGQKNNFETDYKIYQKYVRRRTLKLMLSARVPLKNKLMLVVSAISPSLMGTLSMLRRNNSFKHSVK